MSRASIFPQHAALPHRSAANVHPTAPTAGSRCPPHWPRSSSSSPWTSRGRVSSAHRPALHRDRGAPRSASPRHLAGALVGRRDLTNGESHPRQGCGQEVRHARRHRGGPVAPSRDELRAGASGRSGSAGTHTPPRRDMQPLPLTEDQASPPSPSWQHRSGQRPCSRNGWSAESRPTRWLRSSRPPRGCSGSRPSADRSRCPPAPQTPRTGSGPWAGFAGGETAGAGNSPLFLGLTPHEQEQTRALRRGRAQIPMARRSGQSRRLQYLPARPDAPPPGCGACCYACGATISRLSLWTVPVPRPTSLATFRMPEPLASSARAVSIFFLST